MSEQISMVLFGLTGQGKSSIANMMVQGDIRHKDNKFVVNDDAVGASATIQCNSNDKFIVHDTIGVGETKSGSVPHKEAVKRIRNYFSLYKKPLNYIAFVKKKGRFTEEDHHPIIPVDFPWSEDDDFYESVIKRKKRIQSLLHLIDELFRLEYEGIELEVLDSLQVIPVIEMIEQISLVFFGLTGQGKSSIANMMIQGDIYQKGNVFEINDGAVGASVSINFSENEYFKVFDTIGVGETNSGSVPHKEAVKEIRNYFTTCKVPLNYIVYVKKKGRFTEEDRTMFNLFKEIFEGCEKNFIIIITNCDERWIEKNKETLIKNFGEDYPTIPNSLIYSATDRMIPKMFDGSWNNLYIELSKKTGVIFFGHWAGKTSISNMLIQGDIYHDGTVGLIEAGHLIIACDKPS
ncbi:7234_t:CDS:2 [Funneliformis geosporum]|uniref:7234_t:CDS:1 n=1 Tax=Funneliformis geosporum TaxID=1117311 RepID=A0A9W4WPH4_9GLOM|nr:7234_t:CDS:2 [Funneliformis geosporum]